MLLRLEKRKHLFYGWWVNGTKTFILSSNLCIGRLSCLLIGRVKSKTRGLSLSVRALATLVGNQKLLTEIVVRTPCTLRTYGLERWSLEPGAWRQGRKSNRAWPDSSSWCRKQNRTVLAREEQCMLCYVMLCMAGWGMCTRENLTTSTTRRSLWLVMTGVCVKELVFFDKKSKKKRINIQCLSPNGQGPCDEWMNGRKEQGTASEKHSQMCWLLTDESFIFN